MNRVNPDFHEIRQKNRRELVDMMANGQKKPSYVLTALMTSRETAHLTLAKSLFKDLGTDGRLEKWEHANNQDENEKTKKHLYIKEIKELKRKLDNEAKTFNKVEKKLSQQLQRSQKEIQKLYNEIDKRKEESKKMMQSIQQSKQDLSERDKKLGEKDAEIQKLKRELAILHEKLDENKETIPSFKHKNNQSQKFVQKKHLNTSKEKAVMIGDPKNSKLYQLLSRFDVTIIDSADIEDPTKQNILKDSKHVWLLTYRVSNRNQNLVREYVQHRLKEFSDFRSFLQHLEGMNSDHERKDIT